MLTVANVCIASLASWGLARIPHQTYRILCEQRHILIELRHPFRECVVGDPAVAAIRATDSCPASTVFSFVLCREKTDLRDHLHDKRGTDNGVSSIQHRSVLIPQIVCSPQEEEQYWSVHEAAQDALNFKVELQISHDGPASR